MNLYTETIEIHHNAQKHPFGKRLAGGTLSEQEYADWIGALWQIYSELDTYLPTYLKRTPDLTMDIASLEPIVPHHSLAAEAYLRTMNTANDYAGLAYTVVGANCRGGQLIKKQVEPLGYPVDYVTFTPENLDLAEKWLKNMRNRVGVAESAKNAFSALKVVMDEIQFRYENENG